MTARIVRQYSRTPIPIPRLPEELGARLKLLSRSRNRVAGQLWERIEESGADLEVMNGYLVQGVNGCTCSGGPPWGHEAHCGFEPILEIDSLPNVLWAIDIAGERTFYPSHLAAFHAFGHTPPGSKLIPPGGDADGVSASNARQSAFYATHDRTEEARGD